MAKGQWSQSWLCTRISWEALKVQTPRPSPDCCSGTAGPGESVFSGAQLSLLQPVGEPLRLPVCGAVNRDLGGWSEAGRAAPCSVACCACGSPRNAGADQQVWVQPEVRRFY